jgi:RNA polymerase sigma-70 factor, ECF subfamily
MYPSARPLRFREESDRTELNRLETEELLRLAESGDDGAICRLFERHRARLRRMVAARLDRRVAARVDASDVVQDAFGEASGRLAGFLRDRPVPYYSWLRRLTLLHLAWLHRFHLGSRKRCAAREQVLETRPSDNSSGIAVDRLPGSDTSPSQHAVRDEECEQVRAVLDQLEGPDRELLELRYVEQLSLAEIADHLRIGLSAVKMRHLRALKRFRGIVQEPRAESFL